MYVDTNLVKGETIQRYNTFGSHYSIGENISQ